MVVFLKGSILVSNDLSLFRRHPIGFVVLLGFRTWFKLAVQAFLLLLLLLRPVLLLLLLVPC